MEFCSIRQILGTPNLARGHFGIRWDWLNLLARAEQRRGCGLPLQEGSAEVLSETPHRLYGSDEAIKLAFLGSVDEPWSMGSGLVSCVRLKCMKQDPSLSFAAL